MVSRAGRCRRPRLRLQVEHGLDARHAALHARTIRSTAATTMNESDVRAASTRSARTSSCRSRTTRSCTARARCSRKMPGDDWQKFANLRTLFALHVRPSGQEAALHGRRVRRNGDEWNHDAALDWQLDSRSRARRRAASGRATATGCTAALPALHAWTAKPAGFEWIDYDDARTRVLRSLRFARDGASTSSWSCNFTPVVRATATASACRRPERTAKRSTPTPAIYGGSNEGNGGGGRKPSRCPLHGHAQSLASSLPPLAAHRTSTPAMTAGSGRAAVWPGRPYPLGATWDGERRQLRALLRARRTRRALHLRRARAARDRAHRAARIHRRGLARLLARGAARRRCTATACTAPTTRRDGHRFNHHKLLLDPYAKALRAAGALERRALRLPHRRRRAATCRFDRRDNAGGMPKCVVVDTAFTWGDDRPPRHRAGTSTVIYEMHVRGFTMRHPDVPPALRGTFAGLASPRVDRATSRDLGVTAVELLPVHAFVDDRLPGRAAACATTGATTPIGVLRARSAVLVGRHRSTSSRRW